MNLFTKFECLSITRNSQSDSCEADARPDGSRERRDGNERDRTTREREGDIRDLPARRVDQLMRRTRARAHDTVFVSNKDAMSAV